MKPGSWFAIVVVLGLGACGPKDVIPSSPHHPANPNATSGATGEADAGAVGTVDHAEHEAAQLAATEEAAYLRARPVFDKYCAKCHTSGGEKATEKQLGHFSMDAYPFGGHHATTIGATVREVLGVTGEKPTMPKDNPGVVQGAELDAIIAWSHAFDASHAAGLHHHHGAHGGHE